MREIKFRAIHKLTKKKWYEEDLVFHNGEWYEDWRAFEDGRPLNMEQCAVMQYAGLKDKNGVEIYEGDIVRWHDVVTWDYSVTFKDGVFCISDDPSSNFYHLKEDINGKFEVIGNIYEKPELLEESAK